MGMGCITSHLTTHPPLHNQLAAGFLARLRIAAAVLEAEERVRVISPRPVSLADRSATRVRSCDGEHQSHLELAGDWYVRARYFFALLLFQVPLPLRLAHSACCCCYCYCYCWCCCYCRSRCSCCCCCCCLLLPCTLRTSLTGPSPQPATSPSKPPATPAMPARHRHARCPRHSSRSCSTAALSATCSRACAGSSLYELPRHVVACSTRSTQELGTSVADYGASRCPTANLPRKHCHSSHT